MNVLFITSPTENIQEDVVYEGLCQFLGPENVIDYPSKLIYHDDQPPRGLAYPRHDLSSREITNREFDAVVVGSVRRPTLDAWSRLSRSFHHIPVAWLHGEDAYLPGVSRSKWPLYLGWPKGVHHTHRFYRESVPGQVDNLNNVTPIYPLPFAALTRVHELHGADPVAKRDIDVSYVASRGHEAYAYEREAYASEVAARGWYLGEGVSFRQYSRLLQRSKIGVSVRGAGWDTLRYWEIPQHGALLASQRLPIKIPHPFEDGKNAIFADNPKELGEKIQTSLDSNWNELRLAGIKHLQKYHTSVERAKYVLKTILDDSDVV